MHTAKNNNHNNYNNNKTSLDVLKSYIFSLVFTASRLTPMLCWTIHMWKETKAQWTLLLTLIFTHVMGAQSVKSGGSRRY